MPSFSLWLIWVRLRWRGRGWGRGRGQLRISPSLMIITITEPKATVAVWMGTHGIPGLGKPWTWACLSAGKCSQIFPKWRDRSWFCFTNGLFSSVSPISYYSTELTDCWGSGKQRQTSGRMRNSVLQWIVLFFLTTSDFLIISAVLWPNLNHTHFSTKLQHKTFSTNDMHRG